jgi:alpha-methylacyl-CoA racemase
MVDGVSLLMQMTWWLRDVGHWQDRRGSNPLDGGAPFYRTYACADGKFVAVGCIEPHFYAAMLEGLGMDPATLPEQRDVAQWQVLTEAIGRAFAQQPRDHWAAVFQVTDACVTPVLGLSEVSSHPQIAVRRSVVDHEGSTQAAPAPRFSRTPVEEIAPIDSAVYDLAAVQAEWVQRAHVASGGA